MYALGMGTVTEEQVHEVALLPVAAAAGVLHAREAAALPGLPDAPACGQRAVARTRGGVPGIDASVARVGGRQMEELALHVLDVAQNSLEAGATRLSIAITEDVDDDELVIRVSDNGRGMDDAAVSRLIDPFFTTRTTRRVGLGIPLLHHAAETAGGRLEVRSGIGEGTEIVATFQHSHVDRAPLGDIETLVVVLAASHPDLCLEFARQRGALDYSLSTADIRAALDGRPLASPEGLALLREVVRRGEAELDEGAGAASTEDRDRRTRT